MNLKTIKKHFTVKGIGLHTGKEAVAVFKPVNKHGIFFRRTDIEGSSVIPATLEFVSSTTRGTSLSLDGAEVHTVEHLLSACAGLHLTGIEISMNGPEVPILDSSSKGYVDRLIKAEIIPFEQKVKTVTVDRKIEYKNSEDAKVLYTAEPADKVILKFIFYSNHPMLEHQEKELVFTPSNYISEVSSCRTFVFSDEIQCLKKMGLARGGSLDNAIVVTKDKFLTGTGKLRFKNEPVRHKILDLVGDLSLIGHPLKNIKITAVHGGHRHNVEFAKILSHKGIIK